VIYSMIMVCMNALPFSEIEASLDLGATELQTFVRTVLPQLKTAIITAGLMAFTISFDETLVISF
jgi:ABC-type spermidine/putrescine transport system permease subunit II